MRLSIGSFPFHGIFTIIAIFNGFNKVILGKETAFLLEKAAW